MPDDLTPLEAAERLRVSDQKIYDLVNRGQLKAYRVGRSIRIPASEMEDFKLRNQAQPVAPAPARRKRY